ncbi:uncharacterized protein LOC108896026 isoform X1 [Lates calcarifer]|uniref:Uncharacterized protein LOC108881994 isoform X1 n=1 Tax=Lates calcarifer TaxID=8187 RepID=A0AAJ7QA01_LATCA|nr:uncharacterized protein LOC108881994 isoform X1 [Lates calcarifer]XP_018529736.1 uncharacterized protein LOC108882006 [Lates calcarifer]XP_018542414.1 uncharacterized protein LOC108890108 isoform X1 [Lates calcarifer]XP_018550556.1 uncharacterized protein LOC108896020 isoform X1 [Lates calcarifer]XP_018550560.1 uncharacterized protein LOC108896023 isoform X1 [Lates calcarifer]XP_018550562.1 uncharacterized protein LOC108896025 isoform X1 [Lates calcarifer]XP_018550563.1 uncharacterized pro
MNTMKTFTFITALILCSLSWISVSVSETQTVESQPGLHVTLLCSNISTYPTTTTWSRVVNRTEAGCVSSMYGSNSNASYCDGFQRGKFEMTSNMSIVFLNINQVDFYDAGLYLCGFYIDGQTVFRVINLRVQEGHDEPRDDMDGKKESKLTSEILTTVTVLHLMFSFGLVVKIRKLQTAAKEEHQNLRQRENVDSEYLMRLYSPTIRNRRPASEREVETHVIYTASRETQSGTDALSYYHSFSLTGV